MLGYLMIFSNEEQTFIAWMMEAVRTSETSVYSNETTRRYIPEDSIFKTFVTK
jgi:hypothetical protein